MAVAISLLGDSTLYAVLPSHADQLGIKLAFVGILLSANRFVRLFTNSLAGYVHDHTGRWWHFVAALAVGACTTAAYGLFWGFWVFLIARLVWGTCWSFLRLEGYATVIKHATAQSRGKLMGMYQSIVGVGFFAGSLLGGILTDTIGYRKCLLSFAALTLLGAMITFLERSRNGSLKEAETRGDRDEGIEKGKKREGKEEPVLSETKEWKDANYASRFTFHVSRFTFHVSHLLSLINAKRRLPRHWRIYYVGFANVLVSSSIVSSTLGLLIKTRLGSVIQFGRISVKVASLTGILLSLRWCLSFFFAPILGHQADRLGRRFVLLPGLLVGVVALAVLATQDGFLWVGIAAILTAISSAAVSVSLDAAIADVASAGKRGKTIGIYTTFLDVGSAMGPLVSYLVSALIGARLGLERMYWAGVFLLMLGVLASWGIKGVVDESI